jgi:23S rRNA-/tRNA-specific pseudouridylate synthase
MESGKDAETRFKVLQRMSRATLLELEPVTGRTNQLRIHCAHIGHAIIGDEMHGDCESRMSNVELGTEDQSETQQSTISNSQSGTRLCLHAWKLSFHHPTSGEWIEFTSSVPADMALTIERYRER